LADQSWRHRSSLRHQLQNWRMVGLSVPSLAINHRTAPPAAQPTILTPSVERSDMRPSGLEVLVLGRDVRVADDLSSHGGRQTLLVEARSMRLRGRRAGRGSRTPNRGGHPRDSGRGHHKRSAADPRAKSAISTAQWCQGGPPKRQVDQHIMERWDNKSLHKITGEFTKKFPPRRPKPEPGGDGTDSSARSGGGRAPPLRTQSNQRGRLHIFDAFPVHRDRRCRLKRARCAAKATVVPRPDLLDA
jgi:hypothetical protein